MRTSFINTLFLLILPFSPISPYLATSNSIYTEDATTQKFIDRRKASNNTYFQSLHTITRDALKPRAGTDPNYIEPAYVNDLIKYAIKSWPGHYQLQYSFLRTELSYYKDTKQKSWYVYHDPPRGISSQEYNSMKKNCLRVRSS